MDYKVLIEKFYHGDTSCEEEDLLRRYLMGDEFPADVLQEKELLLVMLQPTEYDCKEAMNGIAAMIDELAVQDDSAGHSLQPALRRVRLRYLYPAVAVAASLLLFYQLFPYSNGDIDTPGNSFVADAVTEEHGGVEVILPDIVESSVGNDVVGDVMPKTAPMATKVTVEPNEKLVATVTRSEKSFSDVDEQPVYFGSWQSDGAAKVETLSNASGVTVKRNILLGSTSRYSGYMSENEIITDPEDMELRKRLHEEEYRSKLEEMAKANEALASDSPFPPHIESLLLVEYGSKEMAEGQILTAGSAEFAREEVPWNPAYPLQVYGIHDEGNETIVTFLFSVCHNSQCIAFSKGIYAQDLENGDIYNVLGYTDGLDMSRLFVVKDCIGKNLLVSLRFPKFKRKVRTITIHNPGHADDIKPVNGRGASLKVLAEKVDVKEMRRRYR